MASDFNTLVALRIKAAAQVEQYSQYAGHFDATVLAVAKCDVMTKMGRAISKGETILLFEGSQVGQSFVDVWSMNNAVRTSVPATSVRVI